MEKSIKKKRFTKKEVIGELKNISLVLLGCLVLAFADAIFIIPCNIVNGGIDSLGIIVNHYLEPIFNFNVTDIVLAVVQMIFWVIGISFLGMKFSIHTLLGTIAFPVFYAIMLRLNLVENLGIQAMYLKNTNPDGSLNLAVLMMAGLFGGVLSGAGVAFTYLGNGSTGGTDVISFIIAKYSEIKQDISGFVMDTSFIVAGIIVFKDWELGLVGVLSAFACALAIQFIYIYANSFIITDIISEKTDIIQDYIHKEMKHGSTIVNVVGGFSGEKRKIIRVLIFKIEMSELKNFIGAVDPNAIVTFTQAKTINGVGFEPFTVSSKERKKILKRYAASRKKRKTNEKNKPTIK